MVLDPAVDIFNRDQLLAPAVRFGVSPPASVDVSVPLPDVLDKVTVLVSSTSVLFRASRAVILRLKFTPGFTPTGAAPNARWSATTSIRFVPPPVVAPPASRAAKPDPVLSAVALLIVMVIGSLSVT